MQRAYLPSSGVSVIQMSCNISVQKSPFTSFEGLGFYLIQLVFSTRRFHFGRCAQLHQLLHSSQLLRLRFKCRVAWRALSLNFYGSLVNGINRISRDTSLRWILTNNFAIALRSDTHSSSIDAFFDFERFYTDHGSTSQPIKCVGGRVEAKARPDQETYQIREIPR